MHLRTALTGFAFSALLLFVGPSTVVAANGLTGECYDASDFTSPVTTS